MNPTHLPVASLNRNPHPRIFGMVIATACWIFVPVSGQAADDTWVGGTNGNWSNTANWLSGSNAPGATTGTTNADTAIFDSASSNTLITIDADRNVKNLTFDTSSVAYTIGSAGANAGNALNLTSGGAITLTSAVADGTTITFNAPLSLYGSYKIDNQSTGTAGFEFAGNISAGGTGAYQVTILTSATGTGPNLFSGAINDGNGSVKVFIGQFTGGSGTGTVEFTGASNYSGLTTLDFAQSKPLGTGMLTTSGTNSSNGDILIQHGTLNLNNASNGGIAHGLLTLFGGGYLQAQSDAAGTLDNEVKQTNSFTVAGSHNITFDGNFTNGTASSRPLTNSIASGKKLTINGDLYLSDSTDTARTWQLRGSGETIINGAVKDFSGGRGNVASSLDFSTVSGGARSLTLNGINTYSGNTILAGGSATVFTLGQTGALTFYIGANGVNNSISGSGTANFNGTFIFDLTGADTTDGNSWHIVDVGTVFESFSGTFAVQGFSGSAGVWTNGGFSFSEATGDLTYTAAIPEPSTYAMLGGLGAVVFAFGHRRTSHLARTP
jgi:hypothetical protein